MGINTKLAEQELNTIKQLMESKLSNANKAEIEYKFLLKELKKVFDVDNLGDASELLSDIKTDKNVVETNFAKGIKELKEKIEKAGLLHD